MDQTVRLRQAVQAHGKEVETLVLREPNGEDITVCGYPMKFGDGEAQPEAKAISKYIARLADVPPSTVKQLSTGDYNECLMVIMGFFMPPESLQQNQTMGSA